MFELSRIARTPTSRRDFLQKLCAAPLATIPDSKLFKALTFSRDDDLTARLAADPLRPQFHLLPAKNWMNDPNGPILWEGMYHMFFQYNPNAAVWGDMHWAHAISPDMIRWKHLPVALADQLVERYQHYVADYLRGDLAIRRPEVALPVEAL